MAAYIACLVLFLAMTRSTNADYCLCREGVSNDLMQKNIDYACGNGANCSPILQNGACYNPNTVKDHCNYAVNSYYQAKSEVGGSCNFSGTATTSTTPPQTVSSTCVYPSTAGSTVTPSTGSTTPSTGSTTPSTGTSGSGGTLTPGSTTSPTFGPSGTSINPDGAAGIVHHNLLLSLAATILLTGLLCYA